MGVGFLSHPPNPAGRVRIPDRKRDAADSVAMVTPCRYLCLCAITNATMSEGDEVTSASPSLALPRPALGVPNQWSCLAAPPPLHPLSLSWAGRGGSRSSCRLPLPSRWHSATGNVSRGQLCTAGRGGVGAELAQCRTTELNSTAGGRLRGGAGRGPGSGGLLVAASLVAPRTLRSTKSSSRQVSLLNPKHVKGPAGRGRVRGRPTVAFPSVDQPKLGGHRPAAADF